jgi:hypothetical protein
MVTKGTIKADHIPLNKFQLLVAGLPPLAPITVSGLEEEVQRVELPDRTAASGGNSNPIEFDAEFQAHDSVEAAALELWLAEARDPVSPAYKKVGTLIMQSLSGEGFRSFTLNGLWISKRATPDLDMANEGELATITYTFSADEMFPL